MHSKYEIDIHGTSRQYNENGRLHSYNDEPAVIYTNGDKIWYKDGKQHRDNDQPAVILVDGHKEWWVDGKRHRDNDQPAIIYKSGTQIWYKDGKRHRDNDLPAFICPDGSKYWYKDGVRITTSTVTNIEGCLNIVEGGYHLREIKFKGKYGTIDKIKEELDELEEAIEQNNKILMLVELSDLYGSIKGFLEKEYTNLTMEDLKNMNIATERVFKNGIRKSKD